MTSCASHTKNCEKAKETDIPPRSYIKNEEQAMEGMAGLRIQAQNQIPDITSKGSTFSMAKVLLCRHCLLDKDSCLFVCASRTLSPKSFEPFCKVSVLREKVLFIY